MANHLQETRVREENLQGTHIGPPFPSWHRLCLLHNATFSSSFFLMFSAKPLKMFKLMSGIIQEVNVFSRSCGCRAGDIG